MKRCCEDFGDNLFGLDVVSDITLKESANISQRELTQTRSFAPRFRNLAPAKYLDLLAIIVIYTVRPYIDRAIDG